MTRHLNSSLRRVTATPPGTPRVGFGSRGAWAVTSVTLLGLGLVACSSASPSATVPVPAPAPDPGVHTHGKFVWVDLVTDDPSAARRFYGAVFGWQFEDEGSGDDLYIVIRNRGMEIGGIVPLGDDDQDVPEAIWIPSLSVADVDAATDWIGDNGGEVFDEPYDVPGRGRMSVVADPQGAALALLKTARGDPADREPEVGDWSWIELWTTDVGIAAGFYSALVGYQFGALDSEGETYWVLTTAGTPRAGLVEVDWEGVDPNWMPHVRIADAAATTARVEAEGGSILVPAQDDLGGGRIAVIADPTGGVLVVKEEGR